MKRPRRLVLGSLFLPLCGALFPLPAVAGETVVPLRPAAREAAVGTITPAPPPPSSGDATASAATLEIDGERTRFRLALSKGVTAEIYTLSNPYRVIVDLPNVVFQLSEATGREGQGLVKAFRYGLFAEGKGRVVLDATGPVRIERAAIAASPDGGGGQDLVIELAAVSAQSFGAGTGANRTHNVQQGGQGTRPAAPQAGDPPSRKSGKPVIVVDPGHGGIDGGASGPSGQSEKTIVLAVGKELARALEKTGRYDVRLTRASDVFISLDRRLDISRHAGADLFISLHADSLAEAQFADTVRGATIYTLSGRASNEEARRMAEKENASDLLAGVDLAADEEGDEVKNILIDLIKRETANFSTDFSNALTPRLAKAIPLSREPQRSAAFKVLRQTHAPSVLVELGYMSHQEDQKLLSDPAWQRRAADLMAQAVDAYFKKRPAKAP